MKQMIATIMIAITLTACAAIEMPTVSELIETTPLATQEMRTATPVPSATINAQATIDVLQDQADAAQEQAREAQLTSDAAARFMIDVTVTHEWMQYQNGLQTVTMEAIMLQNAAMTMEAGWQTATAQATAVPMTIAAQQTSDAIITTVLAMTVNAPAQAQAMAAAENEARYGWMNYVAVASISVMGCLMILWAIIYLNDQRKPQATIPAPAPNGYDPIPMHETEPGRTLRSEILCSKEQLVELANGIINNSKTLAFGQWRGAELYANLNNIRKYLVQHEMAYELQGKQGELELTQSGWDFMRDTAELGEPPLPHVCKLPSPIQGAVN